MATIPEVTTIGRRLKGPGGPGVRPFGVRVNAFSGGFESDEEADRREDRDEEDEEQEEDDTIEEIVAVGTATATKARIPAGLTRAEFNLGRTRAGALNRAFDAMNRKAVTDKLAPKKKIPEIVVKAKRIPKAISGLLRFGGPVTFVADIAGRMADQISRRRLDEAGEVATRTVRPGPDTKVRTIEPETIPEIFVTAKRKPVERPRITRRDLRNFRNLGDPRVGFPDQRPDRDPKPKVKRPTLPKENPGLIKLSQPNPLPRSIQLGIPRRRPGEPGVRTRSMPGPGGLTGVGPGLVPLAMGQPVHSQRCPPCPKPKKKNRTKCYKKLVKETTNPRNDKVFKLVEINCRSGKEISKRKR